MWQSTVHVFYLVRASAHALTTWLRILYEVLEEELKILDFV